MSVVALCVVLLGSCWQLGPSAGWRVLRPPRAPADADSGPFHQPSRGDRSQSAGGRPVRHHPMYIPPQRTDQVPAESLH